MTTARGWAASRPGGLALAAIRVALGALFVFAASTKVGDMHQFAEEAANYRVLPPSLVPALSAALVGVEIVCGLLLLAGAFTRPAALLVSLLLLGFIGGLSQAIVRGIDLSCGCFGGAEPATWGTVARDVAMLAGSLLVLWLGPGILAVDARRRRRSATASPSTSA